MKVSELKTALDNFDDNAEVLVATFMAGDIKDNVDIQLVDYKGDCYVTYENIDDIVGKIERTQEREDEVLLNLKDRVKQLQDKKDNRKL